MQSDFWECMCSGVKLICIVFYRNGRVFAVDGSSRLFTVLHRWDLRRLAVSKMPQDLANRPGKGKGFLPQVCRGTKRLKVKQHDN